MKNALITGLLAASLAFCSGENGCESKKPELSKEYENRTEKVATPEFSTTMPSSTLEGRIVDVQHSSIPLRSNRGECSVGITHPITYIMARTSEGKKFRFIYPGAIGVFPGEAKIKYRPLKSGVIKSSEMIKAFIGDFDTDDDILLYGDGITLPNSVSQ